MKWGKLLLGVGWACVLYACSDDDGYDHEYVRIDRKVLVLQCLVGG